MAEEFVITGATKFKDLEEHYPWIREELGKLSGNGGMLNSPLVKMMLQRATVSDLSKLVGMDEAAAIEKLQELMKNYEARLQEAKSEAEEPAGETDAGESAETPESAEAAPWTAPWADASTDLPADIAEEQEEK